MDRVFHLGYSARLAMAHASLSILGTALLLAPGVGLSLFGPWADGLPQVTLFKVLSGIMTLGYALTLLGLLVFLALLTQALFLRLRPAHGVG
jgi:hypothetical protein